MISNFYQLWLLAVRLYGYSLPPYVRGKESGSGTPQEVPETSHSIKPYIHCYFSIKHL